MDHSLFFNHLSTPATSVSDAYTLLFQSFQGALSLNQNNDKYLLYYDGNDLDSCQLADNYCFSDFKQELGDNGELDFLTFISELEDKSPFVEHITDEDLNVLLSNTIYIDGHPYAGNMDILGAACIESGIVLSLDTHTTWESHLLRIIFRENDATPPVSNTVFNISKIEHANEILDQYENSIEDACPSAIYTDNFLAWYDSLSKEDKLKVFDKLKLCCDHDFRLNYPYTLSIRDSDLSNLREIRVGKAHDQSGRIRVFFLVDTSQRANLLYGFIKYNNDYTEPINIAERLFSNI